MEASRLDWELIKAQLPSGWRELAVEMGLIRKLPPHLHAKVHDIEPILRLELYRAGYGASLQTVTAATAAAEKLRGRERDGSLITLSPPSLHAWESKLGPYLAVLLGRMLQADERHAESRWAGYSLVLVDGSTVTRPGAKGTTARVHYALRLADMKMLQCHVTDEHGGESLQRFTLHEGELWVGDRYYANPGNVARAVSARADVLVRLNQVALPLYEPGGRRIDVLARARTLQTPHGTAEWAVEVRPRGGAPILGRLCALRLSEEQRQKAEAWLRRQYDGRVPPGSLAAAGWVLVFTTVPAARLSTTRVLEAYRLRWQIELEIKREKSLGGLGELPNFLPETIATWLYAKLLLHQIACHVVSSAETFPPCGDRVARAESSQDAEPELQGPGHRGMAPPGARLPGRAGRPAPSRPPRPARRSRALPRPHRPPP